jgi:hypothetical protein
MNTIKLGLFVTATALLGGCVAVPAAPGYYPGAADYNGTAPAYFADSPVYIAPRVHIRPHAGGGGRSGYHGHDHARGQGGDRARGQGGNRAHGQDGDHSHGRR